MAQQLTFQMFDVSDAVEDFAKNSTEERGAIFTRREVVDFILDLAGYTVDQPLHTYRLLEPSIGDGDFLLPVAERLLTAYETHVSDRSNIVDDLSDTVRAVEVHRQSIKDTCTKLRGLFQEHGISQERAHQLLETWMIEGDFLLEVVL